MRESLTQCLRDGIRAIDVDVTAVTFCDCSGLNTFLHALLNATAVGGSLHLHYPSPAPERLFALTDTGSLFFPLPDSLAGSPPAPQPPAMPETLPRLAPVLAVLPGGLL